METVPTEEEAAVTAAYPRDEMAQRLAQVIVSPELSIQDALERLEAAGTGVLLLAGADRVLFGVVSDGDMRRHFLSREPLTEPCSRIATRKPLVGRVGMSEADILDLMDHGLDYAVNHVPILTAEGVIDSLMLREDLSVAAHPQMSAVIMAGGAGTRLRPLTEGTPKPMLPVGDRPLMERTLERLRGAGIDRVSVTTHYLADKITGHFGDGERFGVHLEYVAEDRPLGTAGALRLIQPPPTEPLLVINGDILTAVDFQKLLAFHREHHADATICVRKYDLEVPYGVIGCNGPFVRAIREKPMEQFLVNAGIYLLEPETLSRIPENERFDMTELIQRLIDENRRVVSFPIVEYWLDVGRLADYERAQVDVEAARV